MAPTEPSTWSGWTWFFFTLGATYWFFFHVTWFQLRSYEQAVERGEPGAVASFNRAISGFPGSMYAKMLGKRRLEDEDAS